MVWWLLRCCVKALRHHPIQLRWTRSHPERSNVPPVAVIITNGASSSRTASEAPTTRTTLQTSPRSNALPRSHEHRTPLQSSMYHCPLCRDSLRMQAHILCDCLRLYLVRLSNQIAFNRFVLRLPPGTGTRLGHGDRSTIPHSSKNGDNSGQGKTAQRHPLQGAFAGCKLRACRRILMTISTRAAVCVANL